MKKILYCFIVVLGILLFLLSGCATNIPKRKAYLDTGVGYGYSVSGDGDILFVKGSVKKEVYKNKKDDVRVDAGGGIIFGGTRKGREMNPLGGGILETDIRYVLNDASSLRFSVFFGLMGSESGVIGYSGFNGFGGAELGVEIKGKKTERAKKKQLGVSVFGIHVSDYPDRTKEEKPINAIGVKISTTLETVSILLEDAYYWVKGRVKPGTKAPK